MTMTLFFLLALVALTVAALMWWAIRDEKPGLLRKNVSIRSL